MKFGTKASDFKPRDEVIYIPDHAKEHGKTHKDAEYGIVSIVLSDKYQEVVFVKFYSNLQYLGWDETTGKNCRPEDLTILGSLL